MRFLREAIRSLKLGNVRALQSQIETVEERFECVTARAFASLADMLGWGGHLLAPGGVWLAMKGKHPVEELDGVPADFRVEAIHALAVPGVDGERHLGGHPTGLNRGAGNPDPGGMRASGLRGKMRHE